MRGTTSTYPRDKNKSTNLRSHILLVIPPPIRMAVRVHHRSEIGRFGLIVRACGIIRAETWIRDFQAEYWDIVWSSNVRISDVGFIV